MPAGSGLGALTASQAWSGLPGIVDLDATVPRWRRIPSASRQQLRSTPNRYAPGKGFHHRITSDDLTAIVVIPPELSANGHDRRADPSLPPSHKGEHGTSCKRR